MSARKLYPFEELARAVDEAAASSPDFARLLKDLNEAGEPLMTFDCKLDRYELCDQAKNIIERCRLARGSS